MTNDMLLQKLCKLIRHDILTSTTQAQSGHATSSLSAVELMTVLFFGGFLRYNLKKPKDPANDRVIFSKGHASPLLYSLYHAAGVVSQEELMKLRSMNSDLEGHPTPRFKYVDIATGSLGQGLSVGVGMALGMKRRASIHGLRSPNVFVLLGDSEMAEGQIWEAMEIGSYYKLDNLIGIIDVNRLGQRGHTMLEWDLETYAKRVEAFGWEAIIIKDGNDLQQVHEAFGKAVGTESTLRNKIKDLSDLRQPPNQKPKMIIAKTVKGKGVSFLENKNGWHGKVIPKDRLQEALKELGKLDLNVRGHISASKIQNPEFRIQNKNHPNKIPDSKPILNSTFLTLNSLYSTREAYGDALVALGKHDPNIVVLDAEVSNSTYSEKFKKEFPDRFYEMFIAEQNMLSTALGMSKLGFIPFVSSFAAFLTRAFDQIRMSQYSNPDIKIVGSHSGVSIGSDGASQMALEDIAMMRSIRESVVLAPSDGLSAFELTTAMYQHEGLCYMRTTRGATPTLYNSKEQFKIGGSKILRQSPKDRVVIFATGICVHEALKAADELESEQISVSVVDIYSIKPLDEKTIVDVAKKNKNVIVVEDHYPDGGLGDAISHALISHTVELASFVHLCVTKTPHSGSPEDLLSYEEIDSAAIIQSVRNLS